MFVFSVFLENGGRVHYEFTPGCGRDKTVCRPVKNSSSRLEISLLMFEVDVKRFLAAADMERWH